MITQRPIPSPDDRCRGIGKRFGGWQRVPARAVGPDEVTIDVDEVVLRRPDRGEVEPLGLDRETDRVVVGARPVRLARPELGAEESESECHG